MKFLKPLFKIALALVALALAGLAVFAALFDPNDYRDRVAALVRAETGRELVLAGPLELSFFPWLAVEAQNVSLGNAPGFGPEPMLRVRRMVVGLQLLPLLSGELRVGDVRLDGLELFLARDVEGRRNWDDLTKGGEPAGTARDSRPAGDGASEPASSEGAFRLTDASVDGVHAGDVRLVWDDRKTDTRYEFSGGSLEVGAVRYGAPLDLRAAFDFRLTAPEMRGRFRVAGNLAFDLEREQYAVPRLTLAVNAEGEALPGGRLEASLALEQVRADLERGTASASAFTLQGYGAQVSGSLSGRELFTAPAASGVLELQRCNAREVLTSLGLPVPETRDPKALTALGATLRFDYAPERLGLPYLSLDLDGNHLEGSASVDRNGSAYALELTAGDLDLGPYLPPRAEEPSASGQTVAAEAPAQPATVAEAPPEPAEPAWLAEARRTELDAHLVAGSVRIGDLRLSGPNLTLRARHGVLALEPLDLRLDRGADAWRLVTGRIIGDLRKVGARVDDFHLEAPGGGVSGSLRSAGLLCAPEVGGKLTFAHLNPRRLEQALAEVLPGGLLPEMRDPKAFTDLDGTVEFDYAPQRVDVPGFDLRLDGGALAGSFRMRAAPEEYALMLKADTLDLDRYLPPATPAKVGATATPDATSNATSSFAATDSKAVDAASAKVGDASAGGVTTASPSEGDAAAQRAASTAKSATTSDTLLARLQTLRADADVDIGALSHDGLTFTGIKALLKAGDGRVALTSCRAALDKGVLELEWNLDANRGENRLSATVQALRLGPLLEHFAGIKDAQGTLTLKTIEPLTWTGLNAADFKRSFGGSAGFAVRDGQYPGLDLFGMLSVVDKLTTDVLEGGADESTKFGEVTGTLVARAGRVRCDDLCVKAPGLRAGGSGFVNLPDGRIDYLVRAMAVPDATGQGGAPCDEYHGIVVPVRVGGTLDDPHYRVSAAEYAASVASGAAALLGGVVEGGAKVLGTGADAVKEGSETVGGAVQGAIKGGAKAVEDFIDTIRDAF